ncbi:hypothetical protein SLEP1_g56363 [Rubroshorea leprosula]|uniref:Uncharacterized protein n=1 Tax=Rubroshorea leprosula TaxID=152421 RepID=A0AAV5MJD6_9ROSI|nr:hypothetical protein SLEP1_g56363 [Rubroshorea leprosula]
MSIEKVWPYRLAILAAHLAAPPPFDLSSPPIIEPWCVSAQTAASLGGSLTIIDERTGKKYHVPVSAEGTVKAADLKKITTGKDDKGLKMYDPGYLNTAPVCSSISYIDGDQGILRYRVYPIEELAESSTFLEVEYESLGHHFILFLKEVKDEGFEIEHDGKLITVFSAPNYCDQMGNKGAFIRFEAPDLKPNIVTFSAVPHPDVKPMAYANNFLRLFQ